MAIDIKWSRILSIIAKKIMQLKNVMDGSYPIMGPGDEKSPLKDGVLKLNGMLEPHRGLHCVTLNRVILLKLLNIVNSIS